MKILKIHGIYKNLWNLGEIWYEKFTQSVVLRFLNVDYKCMRIFSPKEWARFNREENMKGEVCHKNIWTDEIVCRYKRPYCLKDSSGEVLECSSKPYN